MQEPKKTCTVQSKHFCMYCKSLVSNFARHIRRKHMHYSDMQKVLSQPKNSIKRKRLLTPLRKKTTIFII